MSHLVVIGISHKTAPVELRERLSVSLSKLPEWFHALAESTGIASCVYLSTCNRAELYTALSSLDGELTRLRHFLGGRHGLTGKEAKERLYLYEGERAVAHLFEVASGLDSQIVGESEILGQVKQAYLTAQEAGRTNKLLHQLFQRSFHVAKKIRTETGIGRGFFSVGSTAVMFAEKIFGDLSHRKILMIGAGKMGETTLRHLVKAGATSVLVSNRSFEHALEVAQRLGARHVCGEARPWAARLRRGSLASLRGRSGPTSLAAEAVRFDHLFDRMQEADIVISSTACPRYVVHREQVALVMQKRHHRPILMIDIAVPRDIEPSVHELEGVYLYNIDDLEQVIASSREEREQEWERGLRLAREEARKVAEDYRWDAGESARFSPE